MDFKLIPEEYKREKSSKFSFFRFSRIGDAEFIIDIWTLVSIILLMAVVSVYAGLYYYKSNLSQEAEVLEIQITELDNQRNFEMEENFIDLEEGISGLKKVLETRVYPSYLFKMIEELTLTKVWFESFSADLSEAAIKFEMKAMNYNNLAEQIVVFEQDERIKEVNFSQIDMEENGVVGSSIDIKLEPSFLRPKTESD